LPVSFANHERSIAIAVFLALLFFVFACSRTELRAGRPEEDACAVLDFIYSNSFPAVPYVFSGKARLDIEQNRLGGAYKLLVVQETDGSSDRTAGSSKESGHTARPLSAVFDFASSSVFGSRHEDLSIVISPGFLRIIDRERGEYYEGGEARSFISKNSGLRSDAELIMRIILGTGQACKILENLNVDVSSERAVLKGLFEGREFRCEAAGKKLKLSRISIPVEFNEGKIVNLEASYEWSGNYKSLKGITISVLEREWRVKLSIASAGPG